MTTFHKKGPRDVQTACSRPTLAGPRCSTSATLRSKASRPGSNASLSSTSSSPNPRREISDEGIDRLAKMLLLRQPARPTASAGDPIRASPSPPSTTASARYLAAQKSHALAGTELRRPRPRAQSDRAAARPRAERGRDPAHPGDRQQRAGISQLVDQQHQFADCWLARAGLRDEDRIAAVCADLGISAKKAHNLRRQLTLPDRIRARVAERPVADQLSATMANQLANMNEIAPELTEAVAKRITSPELHDKAVKDLGAFVHRTVVEDEHTYAVRIDDGAMLDGREQIQQARAHLSDRDHRTARRDPRLRARRTSRTNSTRSPRARRTRR